MAYLQIPVCMYFLHNQLYFNNPRLTNIMQGKSFLTYLRSEIR